MSESETIGAMTEYFSLVADMLSLYLSATTGYLIIAYLVGFKLTRPQLVIVSGLYLSFALIATYLAVGYGFRGIHYAETLRELNAETPVYSTTVVPSTLAAVLLLGVAASLKFMWDVRHVKSD